MKLFNENKYSQLMVMLSSYLRFLVSLTSLQIHISRAYFRLCYISMLAALCLPPPLSMKLIRKNSLIKELLSDLLLLTLRYLGAGLGKESTTHAHFLLKFMLPLLNFRHVLWYQGPGMLLPPISTFCVSLSKFLWYFWHHYPI